jgi:hypothetical protein
MKRRSSIISPEVALSRELEGTYGNVKVVADNIVNVNKVAGLTEEELGSISSQLQSIMNFTDITVESVDSNIVASWDSATKVLKIPRGQRGFNGTNGVAGVSVTSVAFDGGTKLLTFTLSNGSSTSFNVPTVKGDPGDKGDKFTFNELTNPEKESIRGLRGFKGDRGNDGTSLDFTWNGTILGVKRSTDIGYTYMDLKGPKGDRGKPGAESLHYWESTRVLPSGTIDIKNTAGLPGYTDKYMFFDGATIDTTPVGFISVKNGRDGGGVIDDSITSIDSLWSSAKIQNELAILEAPLTKLSTRYILNKTAGEDILEGDVCVVVNDEVFKASYDNLLHQNKQKVMAMTSGTIGDNIEVITSGRVAFTNWNLSVNIPYFVGLNGVISSTPPSDGFVQRVGYAVTSDKFMFEVEPAVKL